MTTQLSLPKMGWSPFFQQQLSLEEWTDLTPARVTSVHKGNIQVATEACPEPFLMPKSKHLLTVGDWFLMDAERRPVRVLERFSSLSRMASGKRVKQQLVAANVDFVFILMSLNGDFSVNRLERYLALIQDSGAEAILLLSKADLCDDPAEYEDLLKTVNGFSSFEFVNCHSPQAAQTVLAWCGTGKTMAVVGSSGVGKSTLVNNLLSTADELKSSLQDTAEIREQDSKGRHTTTSRQLFFMANGRAVIDSPGMRELALHVQPEAIDASFEDISLLAEQCKFNDCSHSEEPGCQVQQAIREGALTTRRFENYRKLQRESLINNESLAQQRAREKDFTKLIKRVQKASVEFKKADG